MTYKITITRVESFVIEADNSEEAIDLAFDQSTGGFSSVKVKPSPQVLMHDNETVDCAIEEVSQEEIDAKNAYEMGF